MAFDEDRDAWLLQSLDIKGHGLVFTSEDLAMDAAERITKSKLPLRIPGGWLYGPTTAQITVIIRKKSIKWLTRMDYDIPVV